MIKKSLLIWLAIIPLAILNGALREMLINPLIGEKYGRPLSCVTLCLMIFVLCRFSVSLIGRGWVKTHRVIGLWWMALTVAFETGFGLLNGDTFHELTKACDVTTGDLRLPVVMFTGIAPWPAAGMKRLI